MGHLQRNGHAKMNASEIELLHTPKQNAKFSLNRYTSDYVPPFFRISYKEGWFIWRELDHILQGYWVGSLNFSSEQEAFDFLKAKGYEVEFPLTIN